MQTDTVMISIYTRAQAIEDGTLVDVTDTAKEAGWRYPVAVTHAVWKQAVEVPRGLKGLQQEQGRLWDVVWMARDCARRVRRPGPCRVLFEVSVLQTKRRRDTLTLVLDVGPGDSGEPVVTIGFRNDF